MAIGLALGLVRTLAPRMVDNPEQVGRILGDSLGLSVRVAAVDLHFDGWVPVLTLHDVSVRAEQDAPDALAQFSRLDVRTGSVLLAWQHGFQIREIGLYGLELTIERLLDGRILLAHSAQRTSSAPSDTARWNALLARRIAIRLIDADILWHDQLKLKAPVILNDCRLTVAAVGDGLRAGLIAPLPEGAGAVVRAQMTTRGNPLTGDWDGEISGAVDDLAVAPLLDLLELTPAVPLVGELDLTAALAVRQGDLVGFETAMRVDQLAEATGIAPDGLPRLTITTTAEKVARSWAARVELVAENAGRVDANLRLTDGDRGLQFEGARFSARDANLTWLAELSALGLRAARGRADGIADTLDQISPSGNVAYLELSLEARGDQLWPILDLELEGLGVPAGPDMPGLEIPQLHVSGDRTALAIHLPTQRARVDARPFFVVPLTLDIASVHASVLEPLSASPALSVDDARLTVQGFPFRVTGRVDDLMGSAEAALAATMGAGDMARVPELIPPSAVSNDADAWLRRGLVDGRIIGGQLLLRGALPAFPYPGTEGRFYAEVSATEGIVDYAPDWPRIEDADFRAVFSGTHLGISVAQARMMRARLDQSEFEIPDLDAEDTLLNVEGTVTTTWPALTDFIDNSPLAEGGAQRLKDLQVTDDVAVVLGLTIPLETDDDTAVRGTLRFQNNDFQDRGFGLSVSGLSGDIAFGRDDWSGRALSGHYAGEPVALDIAGGIDDPFYDIALTVRGESELSFLNQQFASLAPETWGLVNGKGRLDSLSGVVPWQLGLKVPDAKVAPANAALELRFESDLSAVSGQLPWPFNEVTREQGWLKVLAYVDGLSKETSEVRLGEGLGLYFTQDDDSISGMEIVLGPHQPRQPEAGALRITGQLARLPVEALTTLLVDGQQQGGDGGTLVDDLALAVKLDVDVLELGTQRFRETALSLAQEGAQYTLTIESPDVAGRLQFENSGADAPMASAKLTHLALSRMSEAGALPDPAATVDPAAASRSAVGPANGVDPRRLPNLHIEIDALRYGDSTLGKVSLSADKTPVGLTVTRLTLTHTEFQIEGDGVWQQTDAHEQSRFRLAAKARKLATMLETFGYATDALAGAKSEFTLDATWPGSPADFALETLQGHLDLSLGKGRLLDIEPGGGRLFGLLSLQALPRRLSLDFNDIFAEGLAFDRIEGHFDIEDGDAFTNNLLLSGPSVQIDIAGRTGLASQDYDQQVTVTPQLADNLPVAGALFGPVGVGVGAAIYLGGKLFKALPDQVDRMLQRKYTVTGPWNDPVVE